MAQSTPQLPQQSSLERTKQREVGLYALNMLSRKIYLDISEIGKNLFQVIQTKLKIEYEGKCSIEGYIKKNSIRLVTTSAGHIIENNVCYNVMFECLVCSPVEGMNINNCIIKNITKAGIRANINDETENPLTIFIARDHHFDKNYFSTLNIDDIINVKVIGQRFELNDNTISIIASLIENKKSKIILKKAKQ